VTLSAARARKSSGSRSTGGAARGVDLEDWLRRLRGRCFVLRGGAEVWVDRVVRGM